MCPAEKVISKEGSHSVQDRVCTHSLKAHATSQPSLLSHTYPYCTTNTVTCDTQCPCQFMTSWQLAKIVILEGPAPPGTGNKSGFFGASLL